MKNDLWPEWLVIGALALLAVAMVFLRRAYNISVEHGYEFWSYDTWREMREYLYLAAAVILAAAVWLRLR